MVKNEDKDEMNKEEKSRWPCRFLILVDEIDRWDADTLPCRKRRSVVIVLAIIVASSGCLWVTYKVMLDNNKVVVVRLQDFFPGVTVVRTPPLGGLCPRRGSSTRRFYFGIAILVKLRLPIARPGPVEGMFCRRAIVHEDLERRETANNDSWGKFKRQYV
jgi:hypothetical protein